MRRPLFPLSAVLFPGMPLPLYIFEKRYQQMISHCLRTKAPFVVALIREGQEALGPTAKPHEVGCSATIRGVTPVGDGRMHIKTMGIERFRIIDTFSDEAYPTCETEDLPLPGYAGEEAAKGAVHEILRLVERYVSILAPGDERKLPNLLALHPTKLLWLAADLLQVRNSQKQALLESSDAAHLFAALRQVFEREITLLSAIANQKEANADGNPISLN